VFRGKASGSRLRPYAELDLSDGAETLSAIEAARPDAIVHAAMLNDQRRVLADRELASSSYVGDPARLRRGRRGRRAGRPDLERLGVRRDAGRRRGHRAEPHQPLRIPEGSRRARHHGARRRGHGRALAGVQGVHRARPRARRNRDAGFGHLAASIVDALSAGLPFAVREDREINMIATPTLATDAAEMVLRIVERGSCGVFHCTGADAIERRGLAAIVCEVFELDPALLRRGSPSPGGALSWPAPYDTSLDARATAAVVGNELAGCRRIAEGLRGQLEARDVPGHGRPQSIA
jgi:dTDP-4-dehydrorhamnose reductase